MNQMILPSSIHIRPAEPDTSRPECNMPASDYLGYLIFPCKEEGLHALLHEISSAVEAQESATIDPSSWRTADGEDENSAAVQADATDGDGRHLAVTLSYFLANPVPPCEAERTARLFRQEDSRRHTR